MDAFFDAPADSHSSPSSQPPSPGYASDSYFPSGTFTPPEDYHFAPSSAPELSHIDMVHQEKIQAATVVASAYWSPTQEIGATVTTPTAAASQASNSFLSDLYVAEPMTVTHSNGVSPDALTSSGPSSPTWSVDGAQESIHRNTGSPSYASDPEHHLSRRPSLSTAWSTSTPAPSAHSQTPTNASTQHRDEVLPPVSTLLFDHNRSYQSSHGFEYGRYDVHTPPESISGSFELRPVIYGSDMSDGASFHGRSIEDSLFRNHGDYGLDFEPKSSGNSPTIMASSGPMGLVHNVPIMHTDDAASKETQYLRRRCFNCRATEPPSWRRSTLNPGKIVCNKCGLYERTHLRPRPHRFDELRGGAAATKSRKTSKTFITGIPSTGKGMMIKQDHGIHRRTSMASMTSTSSDNWDEYSVGSSASSTPPFNSPTSLEFPHNVHSGPITLPQPPILPRPRGTVRKSSSASLRAPWSPTASSFAHPASVPRSLPAPHDYFSRRGSFDLATLHNGQRTQKIPIETGWQMIPLEDVRPRNSRTKSGGRS